MQNVFAIILQLSSNPSSRPIAADSASIWRTMADALHQSLERILSLLVAILPGILTFAVALAILTLIGMALSALVRSGLTAARFDEHIAAGRGNADWAPSTSPTTLIARVCFWGCVLLGLIIGVSAFDASFATTTMMPNSLLPYLSRVVGAAVLLVGGTLIARYLARSVLIGAVNEQLQYARFLSLGIKWLVLVLTGAMVLEHLEIGGNIVALAFGILFGGIVLTLALAVGLGSRDLVIRSLENRAEHPGKSGFATPATSRDDSIRHF